MVEKRPEPAELPALLTNVSFEVEVLSWSLHRADELAHDADEARLYLAAIDRSAYVIAALVAGRNLLCFFANDRWRKGAPIARDFISTWQGIPGGRALGVANQQVAHIGLGRVRNPQPIDLTALAGDVDDRLERFFVCLDEALQPRAHRSIASALRAVTEHGKHR